MGTQRLDSEKERQERAESESESVSVSIKNDKDSNQKHDTSSKSTPLGRAESQHGNGRLAATLTLTQWAEWVNRESIALNVKSIFLSCYHAIGKDGTPGCHLGGDGAACTSVPSEPPPPLLLAPSSGNPQLQGAK